MTREIKLTVIECSLPRTFVPCDVPYLRVQRNTARPVRVPSYKDNGTDANGPCVVVPEYRDRSFRALAKLAGAKP